MGLWRWQGHQTDARAGAIEQEAAQLYGQEDIDRNKKSWCSKM